MNTYFRSQKQLTTYDLLILKTCFPETVHIRYVMNNKELMFIYLGCVYDCDHRLSIEDYNNLPIRWISAMPCAPEGVVKLHTHQVEPVNLKGDTMEDDVISKIDMTYKMADSIFMPCISTPNWKGRERKFYN